MSVSGSGFVSSPQLACRFGTQAAAEIVFVSSNLLKCTSPSGVEGSVSVEVSGNGADYSSDAVQFRYQSSAVVSSVTPNVGPMSGNTKVLVRGFNFVDSDMLHCRFGVGANAMCASTLKRNSPTRVTPLNLSGSAMIGTNTGFWQTHHIMF